MKHLSADEFKQAITYVPNMTESSIEAARSVLVDRLSYGKAADLHGKTKQWVEKKVSRIYSVFLEHETDCPSDWYRVSLCLPSQKAVREVVAISKKYMREAKLKTR